MAELNIYEKKALEDFLGMQTGWVLDFSDRTFEEFVEETTGINIFQGRYVDPTSKAKRLRAFFKNESDYAVGKLIGAFCKRFMDSKSVGVPISNSGEGAYEACMKISARLKEGGIVDHLEVLKQDSDDKDFATLGKLIKESIDNNQPDAALDRLHTFMVKYVRQLCDRHKIEYGKEESLNAIYGKYIKKLVAAKYIESDMAEKILKFSINILEAFNTVRNNHSFAHDNPILNYTESLLIFNNITNAVKFIQEIEQRIPIEKETVGNSGWEDLPF